MTGQELRIEILEAGVHLWQVAEAIGLSEFTFSRKLRHDFSDEQVQQIREAVKAIQAKI